MRSTQTRLAIATMLLGTLAGCEARLETPQRLWALWLLPVLATFFVWTFKRRLILLRRLAEPVLLSQLVGRGGNTRLVLRMMLILIAVGLLLFSLAGLQVGFEWEEVRRVGVDIVIAVDTSDSMLVRDVESSGGLSRLERAKREVTDLLSVLEGDRVALIAFAGDAFLELPLTLDYGAAALFLNAIDTDMIPVEGTSLASAVRAAVKAFSASASESRALILITDGEDHEGEAVEAAREAADQGVRIFTIGIGRDEGAPIPQAGGGFRRDRQGEMILSRLDEPTLQRMALETGGRYVRSVTGDLDLEQIYVQGIKATLEDRELESGRKQRWQARFQWLLAGAALLLMVEPLLAGRRSRALRSQGKGHLPVDRGHR